VEWRDQPRGKRGRRGKKKRSWGKKVNTTKCARGWSRGSSRDRSKDDEVAAGGEGGERVPSAHRWSLSLTRMPSTGISAFKCICGSYLRYIAKRLTVFRANRDSPSIASMSLCAKYSSLYDVWRLCMRFTRSIGPRITHETRHLDFSFI
jgi:hypothetical protein